MTKEELDNYIGQSIEVFTNEDCDQIKEVVVKSYKITGDSFVFLTEDGEMYGEDEINFRYSITPEAALWMTLIDNEIISKDFDSFDFDKYHGAFTRFMEILENIGIVAKNDEDK